MGVVTASASKGSYREFAVGLRGFRHALRHYAMAVATSDTQLFTALGFPVQRAGPRTAGIDERALRPSLP